MNDRIEPPWSPETVSALNRYQLAGQFHPYTCADGTALVAGPDGWQCPTCGYRQGWALADSVDLADARSALAEIEANGRIDDDPRLPRSVQVRRPDDARL